MTFDTTKMPPCKELERIRDPVGIPKHPEWEDGMAIDIVWKPICQDPKRVSDIVDAFECIGQQMMGSRPSSSAVTIALVEQLQNHIMHKTGISPAQARLFSARILEYCPPPGATPDAVRADLDQEMLGVLVDPQTRLAAPSAAPTGIAGIDSLRTKGAWELSVAGPWGLVEEGGPRYLTTIEPRDSVIHAIRIDPAIDDINPIIDGELRRRLAAGTISTLHRVDVVPASFIDVLIESIRRLFDLR